MEEARAHLSNSWDLEVWAAGTLQMHLSLGFEFCRPTIDFPGSAVCQPGVPVTKLCHTDCQLETAYNLTAAVDTGSL